MKQCFHIDKQHRLCQTETDGGVFCAEHMPATLPPAGSDWTLAVFFVMVGIAYVLGYLTHSWLLPWLRGDI